MDTVYQQNDTDDFQQVTCNHSNTVHCSAMRVKTEKFAFVLSKLCICDPVNMEVQMEQQYAIKFCVRLQKSGVETLEMLRQCYGERWLGHVTILRWHTKFTADLEQLAALKLRDEYKISVQTVTTINTIAAIIREDGHLSVQHLESQIHTPKETT